jgi:hypothetical protein
MHAQSQIRIRTGVCLTICSTLLFLAACQQSRAPTNSQGISEIAWARMALERNPQLEVIATDTQTGVFTVRDKRTQEVQTVKAGDLAAAPVSQLSAQISRPTAAAEPMAPAANEATHDESARYDTRSAPPAPAPTSDARSTTAMESESATPEHHKDYKIERADGRVKVSGPGISIVSSGNAASAVSAPQAGMRKTDPIICEGPRMIHLDNRTIYVDGDGVTARSGCELYLTNSRIVASGTGLVVQDAVVHVANSYVEGASGSFEASIGSKLYMRDSVFNGLSRRDSFAQIQDQGGNEWQ